MDFTAQERKRIDEITAAGYEGMSADDVQLYGRWCASIAVRDEAFANEQKRLDNESKARIDALNAQADASRARLKSMIGGTR